MSKCSTCGYEIKGLSEQTLYDQYGCARALVTKELGFSIEMCSNSTGGYLAPGTDPNEFKEDPDALKEGIIEMRERKLALDAERRKRFKEQQNGSQK